MSDLTAKEKLKGCPFCGKTAPAVFILEEDEPPQFQVVCDVRHGGCGGAGGYARDRNQAIRNWNGR